EGHEVLSSLSGMAMRSETAKIYPGIPEYFNSEGRGLYHYLTGSASWYLLTLVTQVFGVRGFYGDLVLAPKLVPEQFGEQGQAGLECTFAGKRLKVVYVNRAKKTYGQYRLGSVLLQGRSFPVNPAEAHQVTIPRSHLTQI